MAPRPRFSSVLEDPGFKLPPGKKLGGAIAAAYSPEGDVFLLHQWNPPGLAQTPGSADEFLPDVARFKPDGTFVDAWGGPDHIPRVDGIQQWPMGREGIEIDAEGNVWIFGYSKDDDAVLKFNQAGELLLRIGQRGRRGDDDDTQFLGGPTSCYHDVENREVFVSDGYSNHRVISFNSDTGEFIRMWGAYGKKPSEVSAADSYGNPVHKVAIGPKGTLFVCDRPNCRIQEFELIPGGAKFLREIVIAPGTENWGSAFDLAFHPDGKFMYVCDGSNIRIWVVDLDTSEVLGWTSAYQQEEGDGNIPRHFNLVHRFRHEPSGDILLACTGRGYLRMKYLGIS